MRMVEKALALAREGFFIFPLEVGKKIPQYGFTKYTQRSTRNPKTIKKWWDTEYNIGIATSKYKDGQALVVVDVDDKPGRDGFGTVLDYELNGQELVPTFTQKTPTGGNHYFYTNPIPQRQGGKDVLGTGIDVRSDGGYVVGRGSIIDGKEYTNHKIPLVQCPQWILDKLGERRKPNLSLIAGGVEDINQKAAVDWAIHYLRYDAEISYEGQNGDANAYAVACQLKDKGVPAAIAAELMLEFWNDRCSPPWAVEEIEQKVQNAFYYGIDPVGSAAPELQFEKVIEPKEKHPIDKLNDNHALVLAGGKVHILKETTNHKGQHIVEHMDLDSFHAYYANQTLFYEGKCKSISKLWISSAKRRTYDGLVFSPGGVVESRFYNMWRGFAIEALPVGTMPSFDQKEAVKLFLEHLLENICNNDQTSYLWLIGFLAHMVQHPGERPSVAPVLKGKKGVGKSFIFDVMGELFGSHYMSTADDRYITGNFNSHLERNILFVLEEAFWSGNKKAEGILKNLITGKTHQIERKGKESYSTDSCSRLVIIGNEEWLVPATVDERRFAVFNVGLGRMEDTVYFKRIWELMKGGGLNYLLRYLLDYDLKDFNPHKAPKTEGLLEQKIETLRPVEEFWLGCLRTGEISFLEGGWPVEIEKESFQQAVARYYDTRRIHSRVPDGRVIGKKLKECCKSVNQHHKNKAGKSVYRFSSLEQSRKDFELWIGHQMTWGE